MANTLYRKVYGGREFAMIEYFDRARLCLKRVAMINRKTVARAKWNEALIKAVEAEVLAKKGAV